MNTNFTKPTPLAIHELAVGARDPETSWQRVIARENGWEFYGQPSPVVAAAASIAIEQAFTEEPQLELVM